MALDPDQLARALHSALGPIALEVVDESHLHAGHEGARSGGGHYRVRIVSAAFEGRSRLERHRLVYHAVFDSMRSEIHALAIDARAPSESAGTATFPVPPAAS